MRAIFETLFDIFYLLTVLSMGIRMIRNSKGSAQCSATRFLRNSDRIIEKK